MNEININIEGYNVNGICVGCLNYNRKMFYADDVKECFKILGNIDVPDGLTIQVCWECLAAVRTVRQFQAQIMKSYVILMDYSRQHTFLDSPADLSRHAASRLAPAPPIVGSNLEWAPEEVEEARRGEGQEDEEMMMEVKREVDVKIEFDASGLFGDQVTKLESDNESNSPDIQYEGPADSSDEEVQLAQLKRKKEAVKKVKERKNRRTAQEPVTKPSQQGRKLKNVPLDSVELVTLSEADMRAVRTDDLRSAEFVNLKYKCSDCIMGFGSKNLMKLHLNGKHRPKVPNSHQCDVCLSHFITKDNLSNHRSQHASAYVCKRCGLRTTLKRVILGHLKRCSDSAEGAESVGGACDKCGLTFKTKSRLSYHRAVCRQEKPQCDCCGKVFANKLTLKHHLKATLGGKADSQSKEPKEKVNIQCKGCDKVFLSRKSYRAHVVIHDGLQYPCPICGKLFQWKRNLARHLRNHADREAGARHECRECGKRFSSRDCYNNHMRFSKQHVSEDMFVHGCEYCGKKFATKWCLVDHVDWEHLKNIKYQCSVCLKAFKTAKIMVAHVNNIHEGKKKSEPESEHLCDICGKSYKTVKRLKGHVWAMHTHRSTVKSFKCKLCPATFTWQTSIYKHVKMMHCNKRSNKQPRPQPKPEPFQQPELSNRVYFQQALLPNVPGLVPDLM